MANQLFKIDVIVVNGAALAFEDGSGTLSGAAGFENEVVVSASGDDFTRRKRVPRLFKAKIQFGEKAQPSEYAKMTNVQITARDQQSGRRVLMPNCSFGALGDVGAGSVDLTFNVLAEPQWL